MSQNVPSSHFGTLRGCSLIVHLDLSFVAWREKTPRHVLSKTTLSLFLFLPLARRDTSNIKFPRNEEDKKGVVYSIYSIFWKDLEHS